MNQIQAERLAQDIIQHQKWESFIGQFDRDVQECGCFQGATFELTAFCTLSCPMCYVRIDKEQARAQGGRMCTAEEWIHLAEQFRDQGGLFLLLTGGEAMMRPDFAEIYEAISKMGLFLSLFTNGTTVDDGMLELLKKRPPSMIGLTIYGASEETYRRFGGSEGSFQRAMDGLDRLLTIPNLALDVRFTACTENYRDFEAVYERIAERGKFVTFDEGVCAPVRGACSDTRRLRLSDAERKEVQKILQRVSEPIWKEFKQNDDKKNSEIPDEKIKNLVKQEEMDSRRMWCKGGKNSVYIAWDGRMYPCDMAGYPYAFPLEQGFRQAAFDVRRQVDALLMPERCMSCKNHKTICTCIPKIQNEMRDCARLGERCDYNPI